MGITTEIVKVDSLPGEEGNLYTINVDQTKLVPDVVTENRARLRAIRAHGFENIPRDVANKIMDEGIDLSRYTRIRDEKVVKKGNIAVVKQYDIIVQLE